VEELPRAVALRPAVAGQAEALDRKGEFPHALFRELASLGYLGALYPESAGGSGLANPHTCFALLCEELARGSMGFAAGVCMQGSTATYTLYKWGNKALHERFLLPALRGEKIAALPAICALGKNTSWGTDIESRNVLFLPR